MAKMETTASMQLGRKTPVSSLDAIGDQRVGQPVRHRIYAGVGEPLPAADEGYLVWAMQSVVLQSVLDQHELPVSVSAGPAPPACAARKPPACSRNRNCPELLREDRR